MPALQRKRKLCIEAVSCCDLYACCKSTKTLKNSRSQVEAFQQATELDTVFQTHNDESPDCSSEVTGVDGASAQLKLSSSSPDPVQVGRMESLTAASPPNLETIFSPNFEHGDFQLKPADDNGGVKHESPELPRLVVDESEDGTCGSSDYQSCNFVDFYLYDSLSTLPFDSSMGFTDVFNTSPDPELSNSDLMIDMAERYMILPFLERTVESSNVHGDDSMQGTMITYEDECKYLSIHQESELNYLTGDLEEIDAIDPQLVLRTLPDLPPVVSSICPIILPRETQLRKAITLVLDLDETLVHSTLEHCDDADFTFPVFLNMNEHTVYVRQRPFLQMFLERVAQMFEVVIFTASQSIYASQLLDKLDPDHKIISKRIYRESCIFSDGSYMKDLRILGVDLAKVAIVDNSPQVFQLQVNNGIPIKSWFDDPSDHALVHLLPFLETLVDAEDVRPLIAKKFGNAE